MTLKEAQNIACNVSHNYEVEFSDIKKALIIMANFVEDITYTVDSFRKGE